MPDPYLAPSIGTGLSSSCCMRDTPTRSQSCCSTVQEQRLGGHAKPAFNRHRKICGRVIRHIVAADVSDRRADDVIAGLESPDPVASELVRSMRGDVGDERKLTTAVDEPDLLHDHDDSIERLSVLVQHTSDNRAVTPQNE